MISCKSDFPYTLHIHFVILLFIITKRSVNSDIRFVISWKTLIFTHEELTLFIFALTSVFSFVSPSFGMIHDGEGNPCRKTEGNIMSPTLAGNNGVFFWSTCSRQYLSRFLG